MSEEIDYKAKYEHAQRRLAQSDEKLENTTRELLECKQKLQRRDAEIRRLASKLMRQALHDCANEIDVDDILEIEEILERNGLNV